MKILVLLPRPQRRGLFYNNIEILKRKTMRLNKKIFYFSTLISIITLLISFILNFMIEENKVIVYFATICMNIFAGSIVLIVTSLFHICFVAVQYLSNPVHVINPN